MSNQAFEGCLSFFKRTDSLLPPYNYTVYRRGKDAEDAEKAVFNFEYSFDDRHFGSFGTTISFNLENYNEKIVEFCGFIRTDKGYIPPCHDFARDVFHSLHKYKSYMASEAFLQNGFVPPVLLRERMFAKAALISGMEKGGAGEDQVDKAVKELGSSLDFSHADIPPSTSPPPSEDTEALDILLRSHTQPPPAQAFRTFPSLARNEGNINPTQKPTKEEAFCVVVPHRGNTDCIPPFQRSSDPSSQSNSLAMDFCESRILNDGEWTNILGLDITVEECYDKIQPELLKRIAKGNYIVDIDEEINIRRGGMDPAMFFNRLNRVARVGPSTWNGYGFGVGVEWSEKFDLPTSSDDITPGEVVFVQIGAHVGRTRGDPLFPYSYKYGWSGVLVEPLPFIFNELVRNYYNPNATSFTPKGEPERPWTVAFENAALCDEVGTAEFEYVDPKANSAFLEEGEEKDEEKEAQKKVTMGAASEEYLYKAMGVSARGRLTKKRTKVSKTEFYDFQDDAVVSTVRCITFEALMEKHKVIDFKILQVDAEGADLDVLKAVDLGKYKPEIVHFEHSGMAKNQRLEALTYLHSNGYICELSTIADTACARSLGLSGPGKEGLPMIARKVVDETSTSNPLDFVYISQKFPLEVLLASLCVVHAKQIGRDASDVSIKSRCDSAADIVLSSATGSPFEVSVNGDQVTVDVPHSRHPSISASLFCQNLILAERECKILEEQVYLKWGAGVAALYEGEIYRK